MMGAGPLPASRRRLWLAAGAACLGLLAACAPVTVEQAERSCLRDHLNADPRAEVSMGVATGGGRGMRPHAGLAITLSSDQIMGRDPSEAFAACVQRRSGQPPRRPLHQQPGYRG